MLKILRLKDPTMTLHEAHDLGILEHAFPTLDLLYKQRDRIEDFDSYLSRIHRVLSWDDSDPTSLFGVLILAYWRALHHEDPLSEGAPSPRDDKSFQDFMKNELGIFNLEGSTILKAIDLQSELLKIDDYKRRGHRRQIGFLRNEALPLALNFAHLDHLLSPPDLRFWKNEMKRVTSSSRS
jgi:hypothetical protein